MKKGTYTLLYILSVAVTATTIYGCSGRQSASGDMNEADSTTADIAIDSEPMKIERFDRALAEYPQLTVEERDSVENLYAPAVALLGQISGRGDTEEMLLDQARSVYMTIFQPDVESHLPGLTDAENRLGGIRQRANKLLPEIEFPVRIIGYVTPYEQTIVRMDSVVFVGLNHYLGSDYEGYVSFPQYIRELKHSGRIPYDVTEAIVATNYPAEMSANSTTINQMIYEGAIVMAIQQLSGDKTPANALGWAEQQLKWAEENEGRIWEKMAQENMIYSRDPAITARLLDRSPATTIVHPDAPGRLGRYVGYRIVEKYLADHPEMKLADLLSPRFYDAEGVLIEAKYSPIKQI